MSRKKRSLVESFARSLNYTPASVRWSFTDAQDSPTSDAVPSPSPLARILRGASGLRGGGRGGKTRLATYLTLIWVLRGGDHSSTRPARVWASVMGLADPSGDGARAVRDSLTTLEKRGFLIYDKTDPEQHLIKLLREDGSGVPYSSPVAAQKGVKASAPYFRIPSALWETGLIGTLSGPALAMYVLSLRLVRLDQDDPRVWFPPSTFQERFSLGDSTRKNGLRELVEAGVLIEEWASTDSEGGIGYRMRRRKIYTIEETYLPD